MVGFPHRDLRLQNSDCVSLTKEIYAKLRRQVDETGIRVGIA